ncbi:MAG: NAD-dependent epimerase/dehydratase family protein [Dehalococcoidia bacterium]|nr:NAD-dependent epimerase/dehydratase family protein [Dehalococcoidia bacterium]
MARCLVTGGTGFVGSHLVDALLAGGHQVRCVVRLTSDLRWLDPRADVIRVTFRHQDPDLARAVEGMERVFHLAGAIMAPSANAFHHANAGTTRTILEACCSLEQPPRLLHLSSLAAAGPSRPGSALVEEDPPRPVSVYGHSKLAAEVVVREYAARLPSVIVRAPVVYGPRDRGMLPTFRLARLPLRPRPRGPRAVSLIHVEDLVRGLIKATDTEGPAGLYYLSHRRALAMVEMDRLLARAVGGRGLSFAVPDWALQAGGGLSERLGRLAGRASIFNRDKAIEMLQAAWVCDPGRSQRDFGFEATTPHEDGLAATARWYRDEGWF